LELVKTRATYVMTLTKKVEYAKVDKSSKFASINETGKAKTYTYNVGPSDGYRAMDVGVDDSLMWSALVRPRS
jgi:hypothetical protein